MRFLVLGAGAIGGVVGAQLHRAGHGVTLVARGAHYAAMRDHGLTLETPEERTCLAIPVVDDVADAGCDSETVVLLAVKSQDTAAALSALRDTATSDTPIVCIQNGVENERTALRVFSNVYGISVMCPTLFLEPGVVLAYSSPITGILDIGRYPTGTDETCGSIASAFADATFVSECRSDIMRWKYRKLIRNLRNAIEAICGPGARDGEIGVLVTAEAERVLAAAGIDAVTEVEDSARRGDLLTRGPIAGSKRPGGSVWQSLTRGVGTVETDYLSGHIALLGRLYGVPTPVNSLLQELGADMARRQLGPGAFTERQFLDMLPGGV